ncbi:MAG: chromosome segregation protein SMC [Bacteroidota bacterium]
MYLSKLALHGFKSFAQQTSLNFDPGVTAVVGPNGCGKSNIVDAVRWVTGEQRARVLRSDKMDSVIFNGTAKRKALGMSEVTLTIQNTKGILPTEYTEVTIGRRLYRSGESEYLLNGTQCRLKDILNLFMDTGMGPGAYSVIELKMIDEILSENTADRRRLFEEAAGITKYKLRRTQALRKLDNTQANLTRIRDLTEEIGKRVVSLKRQAEKAARAKELNTRLHTLEMALAQCELNHLQAIEKNLNDEAKSLKDQLEVHTAQQGKEEAEIESLRVDLVGYEKELRAKQLVLNEHLEQVRTLETEKRLTLERYESANRSIERSMQEQQEAVVRIEQLKSHLSTLEKELEAATPLLDKARKVADHAKAESEKMSGLSKEAWENLQSIRADEERVEKERGERRRTMDRLANRLELIQSESEKSQQLVAGFDSRIAETALRMKDAGANLESARVTVGKARAAMENAETERETLRQKWEKSSEALRQIERQHDAIAAEVSLLESLISSYEDVSEAFHYLAESDGWTPGPMETVADILGCEPEYQLALDAALGVYGTCIVVQTEAEARSAVSLLRTEDKGQTEIIVLDRLRPPTRYAEFIEEAADRGASPLLDKIRVSKAGYQKLADALLHNSFLVKSLEHGQDLIDTLDEMANMLYGSSVPMRYVAPTGEWLDARGILRGGSKKQNDFNQTGRLQRREQYETAIQNLRKLEAALQQKQETTAQLKQALGNVPFDDIKRTLAEAERLFSAAESENMRVSHEHNAIEQRHVEAMQRITEHKDLITTIHADISQLQAPVEASEELLKDLRNSRIAAEEAFRAAEADNTRALNQFNEASIAVLQAKNHFENLTRDLDRNKLDTATLAGQRETREQHIQTLKKSISAHEATRADLEKQIYDLYADRPGFEEAVDKAEQARQEAISRVSELEAKLRTIRQTREKGMRAENERAVQLAEVQTRISELLRNVEENFEIALLENPVEVPEAFDERESKREVKELRRKVRTLGSINELALESYEEEKERFEFMSTQQKDLEDAEQSLLDTITEINTTAAERFDKTFQEVRTNFARLFSTLFGKDDTADLLLSNPEDPLESPIEIIAKPKGKRPSAITQLSGGEKTLTSTALLFAIYLVKPSPFCILDEVDAPLDEANVERFMQLIREFSNNTQFIMVTHNRRTMELADRLYGVTMQEEGVSKLLGVKFDEAADLVS